MQKAGFGSISVPVFGGSLAFLVLAVAMYQNASGYLLSRWSMDDFTYCYFIPLVVAYLIWEKRTAIALLPSCRTWAGLLPAALGILCYWLGELGGEYTILYFSLWLLSLGAIWSYLGWRKMQLIIFPLCLLLAMIPPPNMLYDNLTFRLKLISTQLGVQMLQLCGMSAYREGNVIDVGFTQLQVVDACSGLRYFFPLIVLSILLAYFYRGAIWKKIIIVLTAIPVSIVTNGLRIASVGVLYQFIGPAAAEGFLHDFSGWFIFMASLGILVLEMWLLKRVFPERDLCAKNKEAELPKIHSSCQESSPRSGLFRLVSPQFTLIVLLMVLTTVGTQGGETRDRTPLKKPFAEFPEIVAGWTGKSQIMEKIYLDALALNDYLLMDFRNSRGETINCYVAFNESQVKGKASHSPATCLPGSGWEFKEATATSLPLANGSTLTVNRAMIEKNADRQLTYYWFPQRGRVLHNLFELKLYAFWDALTKQRTDGALVRIITPLAASETAQDGDARLATFVRDLSPVLDQYIPGKDI